MAKTEAMTRLTALDVARLATVCVMMWGVYYVYGIPAALSESLRERLGISKSKHAYLVSAMYSAFALPNTVLPFFSGFLIQRFGEKYVLATTIACIVTGKLCFALGVQIKLVWLIILGRAVFGLGGEVVGVLANNLVTRWFSDKRLPLVLAILLGASRMGSVADSIITPALVARYGVAPTTWMVILVPMSCTLLCSLILARGLKPRRRGGATSLDFTALRRLPQVYWQLILLCILGYGGINTFTNSAQRFIAERFFKDDQPKAGRTLSITYILAAVLVPPFGRLLEVPGFTSPLALIISNALMVSAHLAFYLRIAGVLLPLIFLGTAYALYGTAFWTGLARSVLSVSGATPVQDGGGHGGYSRLGDIEQEGDTEAERPIARTGSSSEIATSNSRTSLLDEEGEGHINGEEDDGGLIAVGYGTATSVLNMSTSLVPILLAGVENVAGYPGLEVVFILLAGFGCIASIILARSYSRCSPKTERCE